MEFTIDLLKRIIVKLVCLTPHLWPDKLFLKVLFFLKIGKRLDLACPTTFNEKLQWLKLYNHKPEYVIMADKVKAKDWVEKRIGKEYIVPTLGVWKSAKDVDFSSLPNQFVIKCNHNSSTGMFICVDKSKINEDDVRKQLAKGLKENYYIWSKEWPYKDIPRRIIAEEYLEDKTNCGDLRDYKFFCFNGKVKFFKVDFNRFSDHHANYYSPEGHLLDFGETDFSPKPEYNIELPSTIGTMVQLAEILSKQCPFLRVDFYSVNGHIYFGELTFFPASGFGKWTRNDTDNQLGELLELPDGSIDPIHYNSNQNQS